MDKKHGKLLVIDGIDGSGKTTQVNLLKKYLEEKKISFEIISFPQYGKNEYAEKITRYLSGKLNKVDPYELAKIYADDRLTAKEQILGWLENGKLVIANRYVSSSKAHLGASLVVEKREEFFEWLDGLEYKTNKMPREDLTILLNVDPVIGQQNVQYKHHKDIHENDLNHLNKAKKVYLELSKTKENWVVLDCMQDNEMKSKEDIHKDLINLLKAYSFVPI